MGSVFSQFIYPIYLRKTCGQKKRTVKMRQRLKQYFLIALAAAALWFVMDNHFVFYGRQVHLLKKASLDLHDTFISLNNERPETILKNDRLREDGIGELMVELGMLSEEKKDRLESKYDYE